MDEDKDLEVTPSRREIREMAVRIGRLEEGHGYQKADKLLGLLELATENLTVLRERIERLENQVFPPNDIKKAIWDLGDKIFKGTPAQWRSLVGKLIQICGDDRALEVMRAAETIKTMDPKAYLSGAIAKGQKGPEWKMNEAQLCAECEVYGVSTIGVKNRRELEARLKVAKARSSTQEPGEPTCKGFTEEVMRK